MIDGQAGYGCPVTEDAALPPQMLPRMKIGAVILGLSAWRAEADPELAGTAAEALARITAALPGQARVSVPALPCCCVTVLPG